MEETPPGQRPQPQPAHASHPFPAAPFTPPLRSREGDRESATGSGAADSPPPALLCASPPPSPVRRPSRGRVPAPPSWAAGEGGEADEQAELHGQARHETDPWMHSDPGRRRPAADADRAASPLHLRCTLLSTLGRDRRTEIPEAA
ncbi:formin-like protein 18 [Panicum virgatum]|uniref:formin-like protein 18 n=1 Tax=Panicum virgatum TaxID=38727 RepID=UPI0019D68F44|nr:formin-like protein 18 [Panicum virgatum]